MEITNELGLHLRAAADFVRTASKFKSDIEIQSEHRSINAKSLLNILMIAAKKGFKLIIRCSGEDEKEALGVLVDKVRNKFGEAK